MPKEAVKPAVEDNEVQNEQLTEEAGEREELDVSEEDGKEVQEEKSTSGKASGRNGETEEGEEGEVDPDEEIARAKGWKPKDEWQGDPKKWVPADEYNRRGELFDKIESQSRELKETKKVLKMLQEHHLKVKETEYARAIEELKAQKKQALIDGDADKVLEADEALMDMKAEAKAQQTAAKQEAAKPDPRFVAWVEKNPWYVQDQEMRQFADDIGVAHARAHPQKTPEEVLKYVNERIVRTYPEKFRNPMRSRPGNAEGRGNDVRGQTQRASSVETYKLTDEERRVMNAFVSDGIMTKEEYIRDLKAIKGEK